MTALLLLLLVCASRAQIYLSAFGNDNNNGVTPANAVATLGRAYNLASAQNVNNATIIMAAGVIPLGKPTFNYGLVTIVGAGSTGNAAIYKVQVQLRRRRHAARRRGHQHRWRDV